MCWVARRAALSEDEKDIGVLERPVLIFGGPYSNFQATRAMLETAFSLGIPADHIICTGDVVAYCADPAETIHAIREAGIHVVRGNCEESLGNDREDCGCGFEEGSACDVLSAQWFSYSRQVLGNEAKKWMADLPRRVTFQLKGKRLAVLHGGATEIERFVFHSTPADEKRAQIEYLGVDGIIGGHCGLPFSDLIDGLLWHNAGVIGMPANDGTPRTWFSVLTPQSNGIDIRHHALEYDFASAARRMEKEKLPVAYRLALESGLWPNMDVLPTVERLFQGKALNPVPLHWA